MGRRRKIYVPITRSGSSILSSILTQLIQEHRRQLNAETYERLKRGEISGPHAFLIIHPILSFFFILSIVCWIAYLLGWVSISDAAFFGSMLFENLVYLKEKRHDEKER